MTWKVFTAVGVVSLGLLGAQFAVTLGDGADGWIWGGAIVAGPGGLVCEVRPAGYSVVLCPGESWRNFTVRGTITCHDEQPKECADPVADAEWPAS